MFSLLQGFPSGGLTALVQQGTASCRSSQATSASSQSVSSTVLANIDYLFAFHMAGEDARLLHELDGITEDDITSLETSSATSSSRWAAIACPFSHFTWTRRHFLMSNWHASCAFAAVQGMRVLLEQSMT